MNLTLPIPEGFTFHSLSFRNGSWTLCLLKSVNGRHEYSCAEHTDLETAIARSVEGCEKAHLRPVHMGWGKPVTVTPRLVDVSRIDISNLDLDF